MTMRHDHDQYLREDLLTDILHIDRIYSFLICTIMVLYIIDGGHLLACGLN